MENHHGKSTKHMAIFLLAIYVTVPEGIATPRKKHNITLFPEIIPSLIVSTPPKKTSFFLGTGSMISMHFGDLFSGGLFHMMGGTASFVHPTSRAEAAMTDCSCWVMVVIPGGFLSPKIDGDLITTWIWQCVKTLVPREPQNSWDLWMFIPLKMYL